MFLELREFLKKEKTGFYLRQLVENQKRSVEELGKFQKYKLLDLLFYTVKTNDYYKQIFNTNSFTLDEIKNWDINKLLSFLPIVDKTLIKNNIDLWVDKSQMTFKLTTSGSTGQPFEIFHSKKSNEMKFASKERSLHRFGIGRTETQLYYGCGYSSSIKSPLKKLNSYIHNSIILNKKFVDIRDVNLKNISQEVIRINELKPTTIWGYPSFIYELARFIVDHDIKLKNTNLKAIITSGESYSIFQKETIENAFKVPIIDEYNSNEGFLASSCKNGNLHINEDTCIMRVLDENGALQEYGLGQLVVTQLYSHAYALINYLQGDIVDISNVPCSCGLSFRVLNSVQGRSGAQKIRNGNEYVSHAIFSHMFTKSPYFKYLDRYQMVQFSDKLLLKVQQTKNYQINKLEFEIFVRKLFNHEKVVFEYVNEISREKSGKYKDFVILN
jgi:phenylacetate-CoA ligase